MNVKSRNCNWQCFFLTILLGLSISSASHSQTGDSEGFSLQAEFDINLETVDWIHGSTDCEVVKEDSDYQEWQQIRFSDRSFVFRQNKCSNYEGPFVYLFIGLDRGLLIDTGATVDGGDKLLQLLRGLTNLPILVAHSHGHGDHRLGDDAFRNIEGFTVVDIGQSAVQEHFGFSNWPEQAISIDLGERQIEILPIPGHNDDDLAFYDSQSRIVVTGDSLYPGRLYVRDWPEYRDSIRRLAEWIGNKPVSHVLGTHIEMSNVLNTDYPIGTTFQPEEHQLPLSVDDIYTLRDALEDQETPQRIPLGSFIIWPI